MSAHHMMGFHHMMCALPIKWTEVNDGCPSYDGHSSYIACPFPFLQSEIEGLPPFLRIRMSIEYSKQKINPAVIIIVNFHKFNFECF